jgi:hypothetical protein
MRFNMSRDIGVLASGLWGYFLLRISYGFDDIFPASVDHISRFIAYLSHKGLAASTVSTYTPGLSQNDSNKYTGQISSSVCF